MRTSDKITTRNKKTGATETINQTEININPWGLSFVVETELEAYKAVYIYRSKFGSRIDYNDTTDKWIVTIFNAASETIPGIDK